ncbi:hypothetical protein ACWD4O_01995 [Streptomyces sp. NPDC002623]
MIEDARQQLPGPSEAKRQAQGLGRPLRVLTATLTAPLQIPGLRQAEQWAGGGPLLGQLPQVGRRLGRSDPNGRGRPRDMRVRERVLRAADRAAARGGSRHRLDPGDE